MAMNHSPFLMAGYTVTYTVPASGVLAGVTRRFGVDRLIAAVPGVAGK
jgi:hypothetical protein